jgi:aspartyl protease family protein
MLVWLILLTGVAAAVFAFVIGRDDAGGLPPDKLVPFLVGVGGLLMFGTIALTHSKSRVGRAVRDLSIWLGIMLAVTAGYSYREEARVVAYRLLGDLMPPGQTLTETGPAGDQAVRIRRRSDGHFVAKTVVNGVAVNMLVDTGASSVVLKPADARLAGVDVDRLKYTVPVQTANGTAYAAAVRIKRLSVGGIAVEGLEALVAKPGTLGESLLGMTFLRRLRSYEFMGEFLTLRS